MRLCLLCVCLLFLAACVYDSGGSFTGLTDEARVNIVRSATGAITTGEYDRLDAYFTEDYERRTDADPSANVDSLEEFKAYLVARDAALHYEYVDLTSVQARGNDVRFAGTMRVRPRGTEGEIRLEGPAVVIPFEGEHSFRKNRIHETWITWDHEKAMADIERATARDAGGVDDATTP